MCWQEKVTHNKEKKQSTEINTKMIQMSQLSDKDFLKAPINIFKD